MQKRNNYCAACALALSGLILAPFVCDCVAAARQPIVLNPPARCLLNNCETHADEPPRALIVKTTVPMASSSADGSS